MDRKVKHKRSKGLVIMLLPALIFIGFLGWCMIAFGNRKPTQPKPAKLQTIAKENVTLLPIVFEEQQEIRMQNATSNR